MGILRDLGLAPKRTVKRKLKWKVVRKVKGSTITISEHYTKKTAMAKCKSAKGSCRVVPIGTNGSARKRVSRKKGKPARRRR